jgi:hypothetical protein
MEMSDTRKTNDEQIKRAAESAARVADEASHAGADMARRGAESARQGFESGLNSTVHTFHRATEQFTKVLGFAGPQPEELARKSSQNIEAVSQATTVLAKGAQEISRECFELMRERVAKNHNRRVHVAGLDKPRIVQVWVSEKNLAVCK